MLQVVSGTRLAARALRNNEVHLKRQQAHPRPITYRRDQPPGTVQLATREVCKSQPRKSNQLDSAKVWVHQQASHPKSRLSLPPSVPYLLNKAGITSLARDIAKVSPSQRGTATRMTVMIAMTYQGSPRVHQHRQRSLRCAKRRNVSWRTTITTCRRITSFVPSCSKHRSRLQAQWEIH